MPRDREDTRRKLVDAGRQLFAVEGIDAVRIQDLNALAGQRNASTVYYHFGSRHGLLQAIVAGHQERSEQIRGEMLQALAASDREGDVVAVMDALVRPTSTWLQTREGRQYLMIIGQMATRSGLRAQVEDPALENVRAGQDMLRRCVADLPGDLVEERIVSLSMMIVAALSERARRIEEGAPVALTDEAFVADLVAMLVAGVQAPVPAGTRT